MQPYRKDTEYYVASEGRYYDLQSRVIRSVPAEQDKKYETKYTFDQATGQAKPMQMPVISSRYGIKKGFGLNNPDFSQMLCPSKSSLSAHFLL